MKITAAQTNSFLLFLLCLFKKGREKFAWADGGPKGREKTRGQELTLVIHFYNMCYTPAAQDLSLSGGAKRELPAMQKE
jgi:hypothetical protein